GPEHERASQPEDGELDGDPEASEEEVRELEGDRAGHQPMPRERGPAVGRPPLSFRVMPAALAFRCLLLVAGDRGDVLLVELAPGPVLDRRGEPGVEEGHEPIAVAVLVLLDPDAIRLIGKVLADDLRVRV